MANVYVRSTDGDNADNGSTWALAEATLAGADAQPDSAGDVIYVSQSHAESTAAAVTWAFAGTLASPTKIICVNDAAEPPTALATTATAAVTAASSNFKINGNYYIYGLALTVGTGQITTCTLEVSALGSHVQVWEQCDFILASTGVSSRISAGTQANLTASELTWINCDVKFASTSQSIQVGVIDWTWRGGSILSGGSAVTAVVSLAGTTQRGAKFLIDGVDLSQAAAAANLFSLSDGVVSGLIRNCKLPASWSGSLTTGTKNLGMRIEMINCDAIDTNYRLWVEDYFGSIKSETTYVRNGSPTDGTTNVSWQMVSAANAEYPHQTLKSPEITVWNDTTGSAITATIEIMHGSATNMKDNEIWLEVMYLGTSGFPLGSHINDGIAFLTAAADQADSAETWAGGLANENPQKLSVTFTPQEKGFITARVHLAVASKTVYIDPVLVIS